MLPFSVHELTGSIRLKDPPLLFPTVIAGLQVYFDRALGANLLYRSERLQYAEIRKQYVTGPTVKVGEEKDMSTIYGAEHLVRLLGKLSCRRTRRGTEPSLLSEYAGRHLPLHYGHGVDTPSPGLHQRSTRVNSITSVLCSPWLNIIQVVSEAEGATVPVGVRDSKPAIYKRVSHLISADLFVISLYFRWAYKDKLSPYAACASLDA
jgi:hypothetical protein